jgi:hypothetical protein
MRRRKVKVFLHRQLPARNEISVMNVGTRFLASQSKAILIRPLPVLLRAISRCHVDRADCVLGDRAAVMSAAGESCNRRAAPAQEGDFDGA